MSKEKKLVPELRFPEFVKDLMWEEKELGDLIDINGRIGYRGYTKNDIVNKGEGAISMSPSNIDENGTLNFEKSTFITWAKYEESPEIILQNGFTVLVKTGSTYGKVAFINNLSDKATINPQLVVLKPTNVESFFLYLIVSNASVQKQIKATVVGGAIPTLSQDSISKFKVLIPPDYEKKEQQKIASCLSSLNELIDAHNDKLEALKDHKKGLMQNLFPQEGQKVPNYRFPEFEKDGVWEEKELGDLIDINGRIGYRGYTKNDLVNKGEGAISMSPSNIDENGTLNFEKSTFITWAKYEESPEIILQNGFTVLVKTGSTYGKVAFINNLSDKATINPQLVVLKPTNVESFFLYLIVSNASVQKQIKATVVGGAIPTLSQDSISKFKVLIPPDYEKKEQQKIASCLSSLDDLITAQSEKIEQLQLHKKGLMQGLFPEIET